MKVTEHTVKDGPTKKNHLKKVSEQSHNKIQLLLDKELEAVNLKPCLDHKLAIELKVLQIPDTHQVSEDKQNLNNNNNNKAQLLRCHTLKLNYQTFLDQNQQQEEPEVLLVSKDNSRLQMMITLRTLIYTNSRKLAEISELELKIKMPKDYSESLTEMEVERLIMMNS